MSQNEVQKYQTNQELYNGVRNPLETFYNTHDKFEKLSSFLNNASSTDYPSVPAGTMSALGTLRTTINTYLASTNTIDMINEVKKFVRI